MSHIQHIDLSGPFATCVEHRIEHLVSQGCVACNLVEMEREANNWGHESTCPLSPCVCGLDDDEDEETTRRIEDHEWWARGLAS